MIIICSIVWTSSSHHSTAAHSSKHKSVRNLPRPVLFTVNLVTGFLWSLVGVLVYPRDALAKLANLFNLGVAIVLMLCSRLFIFTRVHQWWWNIVPATKQDCEVISTRYFIQEVKQYFWLLHQIECLFTPRKNKASNLPCSSRPVLNSRFCHL